MTPTDDQALFEKQKRSAIRRSLIRTAIFWTPLFIAAFGAFLFFFFDKVTGGDRGTVFLLVVLALGSLLFGSQSIQAWLDLFGTPGEKVGVVTRRWARRDSLVMQTQYIRLDGKEILRGDRDIFDGLKAGDRVRVRFYRHSAVAFWTEKLAKPAAEDVTGTPPSGGPGGGSRGPEIAEPPRERKRAVRPEF
ncbi:MAG: hypothetical protein ACKVVT_03495 [Dehalococcoidia bacterium]